MTIVSRAVNYNLDGVPMYGRLFHDEAATEPRPGILVFPEGFGISDHTYTEAKRFAELGYVALACDLYGRGFFSNGPTQAVVDRNAAILARHQGLLKIGQAALQALARESAADPSCIAACGYCIGATIAVELAFWGAPIKAAAGFHPSFKGMSLDQAANARCPIQLFMGAEDYASPPADRERFEAAMEGKQVPWRTTVYGGVKHSYTNPSISGMGDRCAYDKAAHDHSLAEAARLFTEAFL
jgi:dienelactone hydrolase